LNSKVQPKAADVKSKIQAAFHRHASLDASHVNVGVSEGSISLTGEVSSWREREDAERAAWAASGVTRVENRLASHRTSNESFRPAATAKLL
jgi:osmotically-inducible protein OsmY